MIPKPYFQSREIYQSMQEANTLFGYVHILEQYLHQGHTIEANSMYQFILKSALREVQTNTYQWNDTQTVVMYKIVRVLPHFFQLSNKEQLMLVVLKIVLAMRGITRRSISDVRLLRHNLQLISRLDQNKLILFKKELETNEGLWMHNTSRQNFTGSAHNKTNTIGLFGRNSMPLSMVQDAIDDQWRYAVATPYVIRFPKLTQYILDFEKEMGGQLGRVAIVRLKPHSLVSGHCDEERQLKGFDRFHLVLNAPLGSYMHVGDEQMLFSPGDLFFFENKRWHTAYNTSNDWRIHVIIDIRLPRDKARSLPIYSYTDWKKWD